MPWWLWIALAVALMLVLTRRWNPVSRVAAADTLGRRWAMLVHFWPIWRVFIAVGIVAAAILIATHPGRPAATAPPTAGKASPTVATRTPAPSPAPSPVASPVAAHGGEGRFPVGIVLAILTGVAVATGAVVLLARRRGDDADDVLAEAAPYLNDEPDDADGWPPGSGPEPDDQYDTEDDDDDAGDDDEYDPGAASGGVVGAGTVRGIHDRGHGRARRR